MRDQHLLAKLLSVAGYNHLRRNTRQITVECTILVAQNKRHKSRPGLADRKPELSSEIVTERRCANFRNRKATGGNHEHGRPEFRTRRAHDELRRSFYLMDLRVEKNAHVCLLALGFQHVKNVASRVIAEKLAQSFLVIRNVVFLYHRDKVVRCEAGQSRLREVRIGGKKVLRSATQVGEVAPSTAGDKDLLPESIGALQHRYAPAALAGLDGAHQSRRAATENDCIEGMNHCINDRRINNGPAHM